MPEKRAKSTTIRITLGLKEGLNEDLKEDLEDMAIRRL
jgi:hypothetical protein